MSFVGRFGIGWLIPAFIAGVGCGGADELTGQSSQSSTDASTETTPADTGARDDSLTDTALQPSEARLAPMEGAAVESAPDAISLCPSDMVIVPTIDAGSYCVDATEVTAGAYAS